MPKNLCIHYLKTLFNPALAITKMLSTRCNLNHLYLRFSRECLKELSFVAIVTLLEIFMSISLILV